MLLWPLHAHSNAKIQGRLPNSTADCAGEKGGREYQKNAGWQQVIGRIYFMGRISISVGVAMKDVWEEQMPAVITPEGFQTHQTFIARETPELSGTFEAALILPTG